MDKKNLSSLEKPLSFEEWKGSLAPSFGEEFMKSMERLHSINYKEEFDRMLKHEYNEYLSNFNGRWLL